MLFAVPMALRGRGEMTPHLGALFAGGARYAGPAGAEDRGRRFRRLTAPRSTIVQPGPVHTGLTADPDADLTRLLDRLVR